MALQHTLIHRVACKQWKCISHSSGDERSILRFQKIQHLAGLSSWTIDSFSHCVLIQWKGQAALWGFFYKALTYYEGVTLVTND